MLRLEDGGDCEPLGSVNCASTDAGQKIASQLTMTIPARPAAIWRIADAVTRMLEERDWREDDIIAVQLALNEAVANAIRHGCRGDVTKQVQCSVTCDESEDVVIVVRDPGSGFDPGGVPDPLDPANSLNPSGRGIFLMRRLMDDVRFADGGREVRMRKRKGLEREPPNAHGCVETPRRRT